MTLLEVEKNVSMLSVVVCQCDRNTPRGQHEDAAILKHGVQAVPTLTAE